MAFGAPAFAGLGNMLTGYNEEYSQSLDQYSNIALGNALQALSASQASSPPPQYGGGYGQQPPPMGSQPYGTVSNPIGSPPGGGSLAGLTPLGPQPQPMGGAPMAPPPGSPPIQATMQQPGSGQPPPQFQQQGQQGQNQDFGNVSDPMRQIIQAIVQANPGAPPQVLAAAAQKAIKTVNPLALEQLKAQQIQNQWLLGTGRLQQGEQRLDNQQAMIAARYAAINSQREQNGLPPIGYKQFLSSFGGDQPQQQPTAPQPSGPVTMGANPGEPQLGDRGQQPPATPQRQPTGAYGNAYDTAKGVEAGTLPPTSIPARQKGPINSQFVKDGFNLSQATLEWQQATKMTQSLNGPQMTRWRSTALSVQNTIKDVKQLAEQLDLNHIRWLNKLDLERLVQTEPDSPRGKLAQSYITKIEALRGEIANLEQGGYAPTMDAWEVAKQQISTNFAKGSLLASLDAVNDIVGYRLNALNTIGGGRFSAPNPYMPGANAGTAEPLPQAQPSTSQDMGGGWTYHGQQ